MRRVDLLITCEAGRYALQTGEGPLGDDPDCQSSHCEQLQQPNLAMLVVVRPALPGLPTASFTGCSLSSAQVNAQSSWSRQLGLIGIPVGLRRLRRAGHPSMHLRPLEPGHAFPSSHPISQTSGDAHFHLTPILLGHCA